MALVQGSVKWFNSEKAYGFITEDGTEREIFVHKSSLGGTVIAEGDRVEFEAIQAPKGIKAVNVKKI